MCGFLFYFSKNNNLSQDIFRKALNTIAYRGPDHTGYKHFKDNNIHMGHQRLSILDLSKNANQPLTSSDPDERYAIIYNGEIYNYRKILKKYNLHNYKLKSSSDTEVLLFLISQFKKLDKIDELDGIFSFVIFDKYEKKIYFAVDRVGVKPLYYLIENNEIIISSEIAPIKSIRRDLKINQNSINFYFDFRYINKPHSIFENVYKAKPGVLYDLNLENLQDFNQNVYYDSINSIKHNYYNFDNYEEFKNYTNLKIEESIKSQLISDVDIGVLLSGGIDSTLISYYAQKNSIKKINSFSIGFENKNFDESKIAKNTAKILGTNHQEAFLTPSKFKDIITHSYKYYNEPFCDLSFIPTVFLFEIINHQNKVVLSGDGGDELFGGYNRYNIGKRIWNFIKKINSYKKTISYLSSSSIFHIMSSIIRYRKIILLEKSKTAFSHKIYKFLEASLSQTYHEYHSYLCSSNIKNEFRLIGDAGKFNYLEENYFDAKSIMHNDFENFLPFDVLTKVDRASMHYSIEARVPFLSNDLIDLSFSIKDSNYLFRNSESKIVLRDIVKGLKLRNSSYPKKGFGIPIDTWLRDGHLQFVYDTVMSSNNDFINKDQFQLLWDDHQIYKVNYGDKILCFYILLNWLDNHDKNL